MKKTTSAALFLVLPAFAAGGWLLRNSGKTEADRSTPGPIHTWASPSELAAAPAQDAAPDPGRFPAGAAGAAGAGASAPPVAVSKFDPLLVQPATLLPPPVSPERRQQLAADLKAESDADKVAAIAWAKANNFPIKGKAAQGGSFEIQAVREGLPVYFSTDNEVAAVSHGVKPFLRPDNYNLRGAGWTVGVWDGGPARSTHQELYNDGTYRAIFVDLGAGPAFADIDISDHATHVTGTIIGKGIQAAAMGMAPDAKVRNYEFNGVPAELLLEAAASSGESGKIYVSNHSYGPITGWSFFSAEKPNAGSGASGWHWLGNFGESESRTFGAYDFIAQRQDQVASVTPWHLQFRSSGNNRGEVPSGSATVRYRNSGLAWTVGTWGSTPGLAPKDGGETGYDSAHSGGCAKNVMCVGNLQDGAIGGIRIPFAGLSASSGIGPADDGRIKPDIVANGDGVYSSNSGSDSDYASFTGTSMATPGATGTGLLLHELYNRLTGQYMRGSTLKALMIHTATDLPPAGPDYRTGWGLIHGGDAQTQIVLHANNPAGHHFVENFVQDTRPEYRLAFRAAAGTTVTATLCWFDPAGQEKTGLDNPAADLVNDLDLRVTGADGTTWRSPSLTASSPAAAATYIGNSRDTVEKFSFTATGGIQELVVSYKGSLQRATDTKGVILPGGSEQVFSLILSGNTSIGTGTLAEGLEQANDRRFVVSADRSWVFENEAASNDGDRVVSVPAGNSSTQAFETTVTGAQSVNFRWGTSSELNFDYLRFLVDGVLVSQISGETATAIFGHTIATAGVHTLRWEYKKDAGTVSGQDRGWVDQLQFNNLPEAVDDTARGYTMISGSAVPWSLALPGPTDYAVCSGLPVNSFSSFETTIQGPAVVAFVMARGGNYGELNCSYTPTLGRAVSSTVRGNIKQYFQIELGAGPQPVRWTFSKGNPGAGASDGTGIVDNVVVIPQPDTLSKALNLTTNDGFPTLSGNGAWVAVPGPGAPVDIDTTENLFAETALTQNGQPAYLTHYLTGPGLLSYWWRAGGPAASAMSVGMRYTNSGQNLSTLAFTNPDIAPIPGGTGWRQEFIEVPPGAAEVRFAYTPSGTSGKGGLDLIRFQPNGQHPARGLDRWTSHWEAVGNAPWFGQYDNTNGGLDSATHGDLADLQSASLTTTIIGPKKLYFSWKVSSEAGYDFFKLLMGNEELAKISGAVPWTPVELDIPAGPHTLRWVYQKDFSQSAGSDAAWLDGVMFLRPDFGLGTVRPLSSSLASVPVRKDPWPGFVLQKSTDLITWNNANVINTTTTDITQITAASGPKNYFRLKFSPEQLQIIDNAGFEFPSLAAGASQDNATGWGPDNDGIANSSVASIAGFAYTGIQHLTLAQGKFADSKTALTLYPGRHSLTVALGNRGGFTDSNNRSGYAITDSSGNYYGSGSFNVADTFVPAATIPPNTFRQSYPFSISFVPSFAESIPASVQLTSPGTGRSYFDDVRLVSEPQ